MNHQSINQSIKFIYTICYKIFKINLNLQTDDAGTPETVELNKSGIPVTRH